MEKQKHILFISSWFPNRNNPTHGIFNREFAKAAALYNKVSVLHVCSDDNLSSETEFVESTENNIYSLIVYYKKIKALPLIDLILKRKKVLKLFDAGFSKLTSQVGKPDLIQLNVVMPMGIAVLHLSKKYNIPFIINEGWSGYLPEDGSYKGFIQKYFTQKIISQAKVIMPVSKTLMEAMQNQGLKGKYEIIHNVVDVNLFVPKEKKTSGNLTKFYHVSSLNDVEKNVSGIIRAFASALNSNVNIELTIIGESDEKKKFHDLTKELKISHKTKFTRRLMNENLVNEINEHDALIMFSNYETFSLTVAEAWACGKPVITSKVGGLTNVVTRELGLVVERKNEQQLTQAILNFAQEKDKYDSGTTRRYSTEHFNKEKIGKQLTEIYASVLS